MTHRAEGRRWLRTAVGVAALVVFFAAMLVVIAVLAFSVKVSGHSMEPTLADGDRLVVNPFGKDDVARFDIVESTLGDREIPVVKRVIGMPGDRVQASAESDPPVVRIQPAGEDTVYVVDVAGSRLVVVARQYPGSSDENRAELQSIVDSIEIEP